MLHFLKEAHVWREEERLWGVWADREVHPSWLQAPERSNIGTSVGQGGALVFAQLKGNSVAGGEQHKLSK